MKLNDGITLTLDDLLAVSVNGSRIAARLSDGWRTGAHLSRKKGRGMEFAEARPYMIGDDVRNMDWKITARTGKPHTKLFREERDRSVYILLDLSREMYFGSKGQLKSRLASLVAAAVAWYALKNGDKVGGLILSGDRTTIQSPISHRKGVLLWLKKIIEIYTAGLHHKPSPSDLNESLNTLGNMLRPGARLVVISDYYQLSPKAFLMIRYLRKRHEVNLIQVYDALERHIEGDGILGVTNNKESGLLLADDEFRNDFSRVASFRQFELERKLCSNSKQLLAFDASKSLTEQL
ncbi:DUF58 domain-containing protein [Tolumonas lignilytica]|jgi:Uncharacterized conserved protein (some members contain a von Willebrand factor type A (vWA) domain)|uniref:DUF58 domain-containing protein n=1 Tax=Tolumonas lignilytica TaxID=1283284 RepID=UPI000464D00B|nr:DUF58 domain-containing protein [Tolumonas lignilytica]